MDRDKKWEREKKAFDAMVYGDAEGGRYVDPVQGVKDSYNRGVTDEFIIPFVLTDNRGEPLGTIRDGDVCINFNFRADRARQITRCLARNSHFTPQDGRELEGWEELDRIIPRDRVPKDLTYVCMTRYDKNFTLPVVSPPESLTNILANVMADRHMRNLRVAETEKYAHVTYFFNGGVEKPFPGEDRVLVQSPKVATYDLKPEMSAQGVADAVVKAIADNTFDVMVVNFANADMVGHSGKIPPTITAVETVDGCLGQIYIALRQRGGAMIVTADHGNAEQMIDPATGGPQTAHTTNPVPFIVAAEHAVTTRTVQRRRTPLHAASRRRAARHRAYYARHSGHFTTERDDGARSAGDGGTGEELIHHGDTERTEKCESSFVRFKLASKRK